jgi:DNA repair photolyase
MRFPARAALRIGLVTKSTLIERDIALLQRIAERNTRWSRQSALNMSSAGAAEMLC